MSITWNGISSDTIGVIVERIPNRYVPTRRFSPQQVAGRNGNILLVDKSFPNVEQEYEVYLSAEAQGLPSVARACAEWLMGPDGYCRLEDSYDTTVYREAFLMGGFDIENILNKFGRCTITFSCKPQKYLLTGDTPIEIPAGITTYTGDVVQFDGVTGASIASLSTTITPIQDLHGYSSPWPAGGGKNLFKPIDSPITQYGVTIEMTADGEFWVHGTPEIQSGYIVFALYTFTFESALDKTVTISISEKTVGVGLVLGSGNGNLNLTLSDTATSKTGTYTQGVGEVRINVRYDVGTIDKKYKIQLEISNSATAWTPYSNICPISGRTGLSVYRTGKNWYSGGNVTVTNALFTNVAIDPIPAGTYTVSAVIGTAVTTCRVAFRKQNGSAIEAVNIPYVSGGRSYATITLPDTAYRIYFYYAGSTSGTGNQTYTDVQIELGSTSTTYAPYTGNTYAVDWTTEAGTVYGGTLDVVTGVLTVDRANIASYNGEVINEPWLSSMDEYAPGATPTTGAQVVYELATPLTYQLTAQEIEVLVGENNVWTSSGPVSVTVEAPFVGTVTNPTPFEARPMLEVSGVGEITVNGKSIQILESVSDFEIDCETMEAEDNSKIYCMDFPDLSGGENEIVGDGSITALTVTPRWWTL